MTDLLSATGLFSFNRKKIPEVVVHGITGFKRQGEPLVGCDPNTVIVTRSLLKPWQAMASGHIDSLDNFWTMAFASHSGQAIHLEQLQSLLEHTHASEAALVCPRTYPLDPQVAEQQRTNGQKPSRLYHPCAGKHLLMLAAAQAEQLPAENYWHEDHPIQKRIQSLVGKEASEKLTWLTDSCGLPVAAMSIRALMNMYERFALDTNATAVNLKKLWTDNPRLVGGNRRLDSDITEQSGRRLIAKEGADGLLFVQSLPKDGEQIASCFVKIASGYNAGYLALGLWSAISAQSNLPQAFLDLREYLRSRIEEWVPKDQQLVTLVPAEG